MKNKMWIILIAIVVTVVFTGCTVTEGINSAKAEPEKVQSNDHKSYFGNVLVACYSFTGNTRIVADLIQERTGGTMFEIEPDFNYYRDDVVELAKAQIAENFRPDLKSFVLDLDSYDTIFVGSPVWWFTAAPPVMTFLEEQDFAGKVVIPFWTYINVAGSIFNHMEEACPGATVFDGGGFTSSQTQNGEEIYEKVNVWLSDIENQLSQ